MVKSKRLYLFKYHIYLGERHDLLWSLLQEMIDCNCHFEIYLKEWFWHSLYIFGVVCSGNTVMVYLQILFCYLGEKSDWVSLVNSSLCQESRNEKMRGADLPAMSRRWGRSWWAGTHERLEKKCPPGTLET